MAVPYKTWDPWNFLGSRRLTVDPDRFLIRTILRLADPCLQNTFKCGHPPSVAYISLDPALPPLSRKCYILLQLHTLYFYIIIMAFYDGTTKAARFVEGVVPTTGKTGCSREDTLGKVRQEKVCCHVAFRTPCLIQTDTSSQGHKNSTPARSHLGSY
jgi:hypothetical protein